MNELIIKKSVGKQLWLLVAPLLFILDGGYNVFNTSVIQKICGTVIIVCMVFVEIILIRWIAGTKNAFLLNEKGFFDSGASLMSIGFVPWECVKGFSIMTVLWQKYIVVELNDPSKYHLLSAQAQKFLNAKNASRGSQTLNIATTFAKAKGGDVLKALQSYFELYKRTVQE